jgi:hypothetical protein
MGLPDDNPSSFGFGDHYGFGCHAGLEGLASCWRESPLLVQLSSLVPQPPLFKENKSVSLNNSRSLYQVALSDFFMSVTTHFSIGSFFVTC